jgi:hypothetical protein
MHDDKDADDVGPGFGPASDVGPGFGRASDGVGPGFSRASDDVVSGFSRTDDLINLAAHAMTRGEPSLQLRREIRARIDSPRTWRGLSMWVPAVTGVAAVVLALFIWWGRVQAPPPPQVAVAPPVPTPVVRPVPRLDAPGLSPDPYYRAAPGDRAEAPRPRVTRPSRPLEPIEPLAIEPMTTPLMAVGTSSGEMPIEIDDLRIEPLQIQ